MQHMNGKRGSGPSNDLESALTSKEPSRFGSLIDGFRGWLLLLARLEIDGRLQAKLDPQDVVQEALFQACRDRERFRGTTRPELAAWLRGILAHVIAHEVRRWKGRKMRDVRLEVAIEESLERSSTGMGIGMRLVSDATPPGARVAEEEESVLLARALEALPEDHQSVIILRGLQGLPYAEVAKRLGKSTGAVRVLWVRALARLRKEVGRWNR